MLCLSEKNFSAWINTAAATDGRITWPSNCFSLHAGKQRCIEGKFAVQTNANP